MKQEPWNAETLERVLDRELKELPPVPAPRTLLHRVMLAVHERERVPWFRRAWPAWPRQAQCLSLALLGLIGLGVCVLFFEAASGFSPAGAWTRLERLGRELMPAWQGIAALGNAGLLVFKTAGQQILLWGVGLALLAWLGCVGLTTACYRLATQKF